MGQSTYALIGWPNEIPITLFVFGFICSLIPYLAGTNLGIFNVPNVPDNVKQKCKYFGPISVILVLLGFFPLWQTSTTYPHTKEKERGADVTISEVDLSIPMLKVHNIGTEPLRADQLRIYWSQGWYSGQGWNHAETVDLMTNSLSAPIRIGPGEQINIKLEPREIDDKTEFMIEIIDPLITEVNITNNCVNWVGAVVTCRARGDRE